MFHHKQKIAIWRNKFSRRVGIQSSVGRSDEKVKNETIGKLNKYQPAMAPSLPLVPFPCLFPFLPPSLWTTWRPTYRLIWHIYLLFSLFLSFSSSNHDFFSYFLSNQFLFGRIFGVSITTVNFCLPLADPARLRTMEDNENVVSELRHLNAHIFQSEINKQRTKDVSINFMKKFLRKNHKFEFWIFYANLWWESGKTKTLYIYLAYKFAQWET